MKIITEYIHPPIPYRGNDWVAYYEEQAEEGLRGWGKTEQEAIDDLKEQDNYYTKEHGILIDKRGE